MKYCEGFKYQLREDEAFQTDIYPEEDIHAELVSLYTTGRLVVKKYFAWDGCSGPTIDDKTNMRACLCHDALYYLMRTRKLNLKWRNKADMLLKSIMIEDGAVELRAKLYYNTVDTFAGECAKPENARRVLTAP